MTLRYLSLTVFISLAWNIRPLQGQQLPVTACNESKPQTTFSKASEMQQVLEQVVKIGVPGCSIAVYSPEGWWSSAAGLAKIEGNFPMQSCHLLYLQSISKTYMAVATLKLVEQGKISLDAPITTYLPAQYSRLISQSHTITVRMLLNHTSGIPEYNLEPAYITRLLQHPDHLFSPLEYLQYIAGKPLSFPPGSRYSYRNTNYLLLALIGDHLTGDHARFISETIFKPLGLTNTFYRNEPGYLNYPFLVNSYWDRHSDGIVENASRLQRNNVLSLIGDDGIVTTAFDAVLFLKGLMEGKLLSAKILELMKQWVNDSKGNPTYGLGLDYALHGGHPSYGHSGGGIGAGCQLYYFPEKNIYFFIGINLGTVTDSPIQDKAQPLLDSIYHILLR